MEEQLICARQIPNIAKDLPRQKERTPPKDDQKYSIMITCACGDAVVPLSSTTHYEIWLSNEKCNEKKLFI